MSTSLVGEIVRIENLFNELDKNVRYSKCKAHESGKEYHSSSSCQQKF